MDWSILIAICIGPQSMCLNKLLHKECPTHRYTRVVPPFPKDANLDGSKFYTPFKKNSINMRWLK